MRNSSHTKSSLQQAREAILGAQRVLITTGAGMSVDSGLPDFRGPEGFWRAYPKLRDTKLKFEEMASPASFRLQPRLAWAFYGHRLALYRCTPPHPGHARLVRLIRQMPEGGFIVTSNVDGAFLQAGLPTDLIYEIHGSIHYMQCCTPCCEDIWSADGENIRIADELFKATGSLPGCPSCGQLARPNILMFSDGEWLSARSDSQARCFHRWLQGSQGKLIVIEIGAGSVVPSIRQLSERVVQQTGATLIRINPREPECAIEGSISLPLGALEAIGGML